MKIGAYRIALVIIFVVLAGIPLFAAATDQPFYLDLFTRVMVFAIAALSLDSFSAMAAW